MHKKAQNISLFCAFLLALFSWENASKQASNKDETHPVRI